MAHRIPETHRDSEALIHLIWELARMSRRRVAARLETLGLTPGRVRALRVIANASKPMRIGELAGELDMAPRSATTVVDELAADGLVNRLSDPEDRRAILIELTASGAEIVRSSAQMRTAVASEIFKVLTEDERRQLRVILEKTVQ